MERARRMKSAGVATTTWGGKGGGVRKLIPTATWRRGARVVGSSLWRALRADHVTMER